MRLVPEGRKPDGSRANLSMVRWFVRRAIPGALWALRAIAPARHHVVVHGFPSVEGNSTEVVRALESMYDGRIYWLDSPGPEYAEIQGIGRSGRVVHRDRNSLRAIVAYLLAEAVFFTHGLYGMPPVVRRKLTVNLWHGDSFKLSDPLFPDRHLRGRCADFQVAATKVLGDAYALAASDPPPRPLFLGYPRWDQLRSPCSNADLLTLGIAPDSLFVVWLPTFRQARSVSATPRFADTVDPEADASLAGSMQWVVDALRVQGIQCVIKPHPLDRNSREVSGAVCLDEDDLVRAGVPLYSLLARSAGLVSDVSSVAIDFLAIDRPIAFFFPDRHSYARGRGIFPPDALNRLPGPLLDVPADLDSFIADVLSGGEASASQRSETAKWLGLVDQESNTAALLTAIAEQYNGPFAGRIAPRSVDAHGR